MATIQTFVAGESIDMPKLATDIDELMRLSEDEREKYEAWVSSLVSETANR